MNLYNSIYGISGTTIVKSGAGFILGVSVVTAGSAAGGIYDAATTSGASALGPIAISVPATTGLVPGMPDVGWPCTLGIIVVPGSGQVLNVAFQ